MLGGQPGCGDDLAREQHLFELLARFDAYDVRRRHEFGNVLVARQHPGDLRQVNAVLVLQHAARPHAGGDGVAAVDADLPAFEMLRFKAAARGVVQHGAMVESAHQEHRQRGDALACGARAQIGRYRHFADVKFAAARHAPERLDDRRNFLEVEGEALRRHRAVFQRAGMTERLDRGFQV